MQNNNEKSKWYKKAVVYQIYPRSFYDGNSDGVGDLAGIISKLDYLESLGITAIWLSPIYKSPMVDFGYDISDHTDIDPIFGNLNDFDELIRKAHQHDIKILMDYIPNHTSDQHPWFMESRSSKDNPKRDWYLWQKPKPDNGPPNNWLSIFGGSGWQFDPQTEEYYFHSFLKEQPDLNWHNPAVRKAMSDVLKFWLSRGVDGFRMDAVLHMIKDIELRDNPPNPYFIPGQMDPYFAQFNTYSFNRPETLEILKEFCGILENYGDRFMVTEAYVPINDMLGLYRISESDVHSPFNFNLISMPWDAEEYKKFIDHFETQLQPQDIPNYVLGNHDKPRIASRIGKKKAKVAALLELTLRGMPFIYYGEEIGMEDVKIPTEESKDPFERNVPGFGLGRDPQRTPMQWSPKSFAGFSKVKPWLPISDEYMHCNVQTELADSRSFLNLYKSLLSLRKQSEALLYGQYEPIDTGEKNIFAYGRNFNGQRLLIILNFSHEKQIIKMSIPEGQIILNTEMDRPKGERVNLANFTVDGDEGFLIQIP